MRASVCALASAATVSATGADELTKNFQELAVRPNIQESAIDSDLIGADCTCSNSEAGVPGKLVKTDASGNLLEPETQVTQRLLNENSVATQEEIPIFFYGNPSMDFEESLEVCEPLFCRPRVINNFDDYLEHYVENEQFCRGYGKKKFDKFLRNKRRNNRKNRNNNNRDNKKCKNEDEEEDEGNNRNNRKNKRNNGNRGGNANNRNNNRSGRHLQETTDESCYCPTCIPATAASPFPPADSGFVQLNNVVKATFAGHDITNVARTSFALTCNYESLSTSPFFPAGVDPNLPASEQNCSVLFIIGDQLRIQAATSGNPVFFI